MARAKSGDRVLGPYREVRIVAGEEHERWRLHVWIAGQLEKPAFDSEEEALLHKAGAMKASSQRAQTTIADAMREFIDSLKEERRPRTVEALAYSLRIFFEGLEDLRIERLTPQLAAKTYEKLRTRSSRRTTRYRVLLQGVEGIEDKTRIIGLLGEVAQVSPQEARALVSTLPREVVSKAPKAVANKIGARLIAAGAHAEVLPTGLAPAYHRRALKDAQRLAVWAVGKKLLPEDPFAQVQPRGRIGRRKPQIGLDEARIYYATALKAAQAGEQGGLAVCLALTCGLAASEVTLRLCRDLDDGGRVLRITDGKTENRIGTKTVPEELRPLLLKLKDGRFPLAPLFYGQRRGEDGTVIEHHHGREWVWWWAQEMCRRSGAGLDEYGEPRLGAHSLRGMFGSILVAAGEDTAIVSRALRHADERVSIGHYIDPGVLAEAQQAKGLKRLRGGE